MLKNLFKNFKNWRINKINRQKDKEDEGIILPLSHSHGLKVIVKLQLVKIRRKFLAKKWQYSAVFMILILFSSGLFWLQKDYIAKGATYGWVQSTWSGGADTGAVANHTSNQSNWTKYYSKDSTISTANDELTLSSGSATYTDTTTANFNLGSDSGHPCLAKNTGGDQLTIQNTCYDASGICGNFWVLPTDVSDTKMWKTTNSNCDTPQCGINGGQDGDNLVANNSVDFSLYPARDACKQLGARLPTKDELFCIYNNKASFGNNFQANLYWSSTEYSSTKAWLVSFGNGNTYGSTKTNAGYVRCVLGQ